MIGKLQNILEYIRYSKVRKGDTFNVGCKVRKTGSYICVPCGHTHVFKKGAIFHRCFDCLQGKKYNGDEYIKDLGLWEFVE